MTFEKQAFQLARNAQAESIRVRSEHCAIDKFYASGMNNAASTTSGPKQNCRQAPNSIHDMAQGNPLLMRLLRNLQR